MRDKCLYQVHMLLLINAVEAIFVNRLSHLHKNKIIFHGLNITTNYCLKITSLNSNYFIKAKNSTHTAAHVIIVPVYHEKEVFCLFLILINRYNTMHLP